MLQNERQKHVKRTISKRVRDNNISRIRALKEITKDYDQVRKEWKIEAKYHTRSVVETAMFRYKQTFGNKLLSRNMNNQQKEMLIKTNILNKITKLGMPDSYPIYQK